jgi:hypothetical protein
MKLMYEKHASVHQVHDSRNYRACITNPKAGKQLKEGAKVNAKGNRMITC